MSAGPLAAQPVADKETLARLIVYSSHVRRSDWTLRTAAFAPTPHVEMSVTRQLGLTESQLWSLGHDVAAQRKLPLAGRADFQAAVPRRLRLTVEPDEPPLNHANVKGWPAEKSAQMLIATEISLESRFVSTPSSGRHEPVFPPLP